MSNWVEVVIARLESSADGVIELQIGGESVVATFGPDIIRFFKENKGVLTRMGLQTFRDFVTLLSEKKEEEAFNLMAEQMEAEDIIIMINMTADELRAHNDTRDRFYDALKKFMMKLLSSAASKILLAILL
jgi:DNA-binding FadR family transcriptional regulator